MQPFNRLCRDPQALLECLHSYDKENIPQKAIEHVEKLVEDLSGADYVVPGSVAFAAFAEWVTFHPMRWTPAPKATACIVGGIRDRLSARLPQPTSGVGEHHG